MQRRNIIWFVIGWALATVCFFSIYKKRVDSLVEQMSATIEKITSFYLMLVWWVKNYQDGCLVSDAIRKAGYKRIAVYGIKELGERTYFECKLSGAIVPFFLDKCGKDEILMDMFVPVINPYSNPDAIRNIDVVIVTAITYFDEIKAELSSLVNCPIISLEELVYKA